MGYIPNEIANSHLVGKSDHQLLGLGVFPIFRHTHLPNLEPTKFDHFEHRFCAFIFLSEKNTTKTADKSSIVPTGNIHKNLKYIASSIEFEIFHDLP